MTAADNPANESQRIATLHALNILDTPNEESFDRLVSLACGIFNVPIAAVSLVDVDRQWFKASCGLSSNQTPRDHAFCAHAILSDDVMVVPDSHIDPRVCDSPLVTGAPYIRFYAGAPIKHSNGTNLGSLCIVDTHPRKFSERDCALLKHLASIAAHNMELRLLASHADAANRAKSLFVANISHEIRTPMHAILGFSDVLADAETSQKERAEAANAVRRNGLHLISIINDVLDISKIESGEMAVGPVPTNPRTVLSDVAQITSPRAQAKGLAFSCDWIGPAPASVTTDPTRLRQILLNLVDNAIKFTSHGSVCVRAALRDQCRLVVEVTDTGIGLTEEQSARIFRPFAQANPSFSRLHGGTGLGLAISRRLAELLGGTLQVTSTHGVGSTFTLDIDVAPAVVTPLKRQSAFQRADALEDPDSSTRRDARHPSLHGRRFLVVEDGPDNQRLIAHYLRSADATFTIVSDGQQSLDEMSGPYASSYDAILMDLQMPVLDGIHATAALRARGCDIPIIALTANAMADGREACLRDGFDEYICKPVERSTLIRILATFLASRAQNAA